jgi:succinate dehydrogenase assembly factor 1
MVSGLQREVFKLYRRYTSSILYYVTSFLSYPAPSTLRMANSKPANTRPKFYLMSRYTFRTNAASVSARDVGAIEHLIRQGKKKLEMYGDTSVKDCWVTKEMVEWGQKEGNRSNARQ